MKQCFDLYLQQMRRDFFESVNDTDLSDLDCVSMLAS